MKERIHLGQLGGSPAHAGIDPERLTWRQIRRLWEVDVARRARDVERLVAALVR